MLNHDIVADYFIWLANSTGSYVSNLKLQKLVYYAQAWHLALKGSPLFNEDFEAWIHGPVIPSLYHEYKDFGWHPIDRYIHDEELFEGLGDVIEFLNEVADEYFSVDAYDLERMTHLETPWLRARAGLSPDALSNAVIEKAWMKEYYHAHAQSA